MSTALTKERSAIEEAWSKFVIVGIPRLRVREIHRRLSLSGASGRLIADGCTFSFSALSYRNARVLLATADSPNWHTDFDAFMTSGAAFIMVASEKLSDCPWASRIAEICDPSQVLLRDFREHDRPKIQEEAATILCDLLGIVRGKEENLSRLSAAKPLDFIAKICPYFAVSRLIPNLADQCWTQGMNIALT